MARKSVKRPTETFVSTDPYQNKLASQVAAQYVYRTQFWKPAHDRMDFHYAMYLLMDAIQQSKPPGYFRYISNDPQTTANSAHAIMTRNDVFWDSDAIFQDMKQDERKTAQEVEYAMAGMVDDIDLILLSRGEPTFWEQAAWYALLRGWIWAKVHATDEAQVNNNGAPIVPEFFDPRMSLPLFDNRGLHSFIATKPTTLAELLGEYPENERLTDVVGQGDEYDLNLSAPAYKMEWWDFRRLGMTGVLAVWPSDTYYSPLLIQSSSGVQAFNGVWVQEPYEHEYTPDNAPIVGVPVNGLPKMSRPSVNIAAQSALSERASRLSMSVPSWYGDKGEIAERGRSIFASVEEQYPQYNEAVAMVMQNLGNEAYGTWVLQTRNGELPPFEIGTGAVNALRLEERAQRIGGSPANPDAYRILQLLNEEKQRGTLSHILQGSTPTGDNAFLFQQVRNTVLNGLVPFTKGMKNFGMKVGSSTLNQLRDGQFKPMELAPRSRRGQFMRITFDPSVLDERKYKLVPRFDPALPDDLPIRAQTARLLLDPRNPVMSLESVLELVFMHPDAQGEMKRIFKDIGRRDPVIVLEQLAQAFEEDGWPEMAARLRDQEFVQVAVQSIQQQQVLAQIQAMSGQAGGQGGPQGGVPGPQPGAGQGPEMQLPQGGGSEPNDALATMAGGQGGRP
jgi:hypothetical protein